jgi:hypothetical protein
LTRSNYVIKQLSLTGKISTLEMQTQIPLTGRLI